MNEKPLSTGAPSSQPTHELTHEETLAWIKQHRAWRRARKIREMWARPVAEDEIGKVFQTADRAIEKAREGAWLCVGVANEPWFQELAWIETKYEIGSAVDRSFSFDDKPRTYRRCRPRTDVANWAARIDGPGIAGFSIRADYDPTTPLHSVVGGYVVTGDVADPYQVTLNDLWLVQEPLFESTYEILENE